jgi:hypothetical protein
MLTHWMSVLATQHIVPDPPRFTACIAALKAADPDAAEPSARASCQQRYQTLRQRALDYLISSDWLAGEAATQGVPVSEREVRETLRKREAALPHGRSEFLEEIKAVAHTISDVKLEIRDELAAFRLRQKLVDAEPEVTAAAIARYYEQHKQQYVHAELRHFYLAEDLPSKHVATKLMEAIRRGTTNIATSGISLYEYLERPPNLSTARTIVKAIFTATPHHISPPVKVESYYFLVFVARVKPPYVETLAQATGEIKNGLIRQRRRSTLAGFISTWRRQWTAATDCQPGYVVPKCRQYDGMQAEEEPLSFT